MFEWREPLIATREQIRTHGEMCISRRHLRNPPFFHSFSHAKDPVGRRCS